MLLLLTKMNNDNILEESQDEDYETFINKEYEKKQIDGVIYKPTKVDSIIDENTTCNFVDNNINISQLLKDFEMNSELGKLLKQKLEECEKKNNENAIKSAVQSLTNDGIKSVKVEGRKKISDRVSRRKSNDEACEENKNGEDKNPDIRTFENIVDGNDDNSCDERKTNENPTKRKSKDRSGDIVKKRKRKLNEKYGKKQYVEEEVNEKVEKKNHTTVEKNDGFKHKELPDTKERIIKTENKKSKDNGSAKIINRLNKIVTNPTQASVNLKNETTSLHTPFLDSLWEFYLKSIQSNSNYYKQKGILIHSDFFDTKYLDFSAGQVFNLENILKYKEYFVYDGTVNDFKHNFKNVIKYDDYIINNLNNLKMNVFILGRNMNPIFRNTMISFYKQFLLHVVNVRASRGLATTVQFIKDTNTNYKILYNTLQQLIYIKLEFCNIK